VLIWDTSPLHHAIRAGKIEILGDIAKNSQGGTRRNITTQAVMSELGHYSLPLEGTEWLEFVHVDDLSEIEALVKWMGLVSGQNSSHGEATVFAWAEVHRATAVVDDADARRIGRAEGLPVVGSLRVIADSVVDGHTTECVASSMVDAMIDTGARYPFQRGGFIGWAKQQSLL
jgi:predicted nucleic acid-binding protein